MNQKIELYGYHCPVCGIDFEDEIPQLDHCLVRGCDWNKVITGTPIGKIKIKKTKGKK